jgi:glycosyltransferase involved in cell wall biosynthesis
MEVLFMSKPKLTIGCACYDDVEGLFWTMSIIRQFHVPRENIDVELLCVDDMPTPQKDLNHLCNLLGAKYVHQPKNKGPAHAKNSVFENASGDYTLLVDSHVLCAPNSIRYILDGIENNKIQNDIWSGPLINESGHIYATELEPKWRGEFFGVWHTDNDIVAKDVKEIEGMGSAFFCMSTQNFIKIGGFPKEFSGFAGEEIILSELNRQHNNGKHLCHNTLRWQHRFLRTRPVSYVLTVNDKYKNYLIGFYKCGWDTSVVREYFRKRLPIDQLNFDTNYVLALFPDLFEKNVNGRRFDNLD